jgi:hypothetical protein
MRYRIQKKWRLAAFLWALTCAGCASRLPPPTDPDEARTALQEALDSWKRGEAPALLKERTPPIQFADLQREKGAKLLKYEIATAEQRGLAMRITVKMSLEAKGGQRRETTTVYTAETQPRIVIVPEF